MGLHLYRRHKQDCTRGHAFRSHTRDHQERARGWKRCDCPIIAAGTLNKIFKRVSTGRWEWDDARAIADGFEAAKSWGNNPQIEPVAPARAPTERRVTIEQATKTFIEDFNRTAAPATQKKYRLMAERLKDFAARKGYVMIDQFEPQTVREFRDSWSEPKKNEPRPEPKRARKRKTKGLKKETLSAPTVVRRMAELKVFFEFCLSNNWIPNNPARAIKNPRTRDAKDREPQKLPFTDEDLKRMYDACEVYGGTYRHRWHGADLEDFISISVYTGLRISDVALFRGDRMLSSGEVKIRTTKAGTHVYTWVPEWLQERIKARIATHGNAIFGEHKENASLNVVTETWRRRLNDLWESCGEWKENPHPHRFRHTFARILLQKPGITVRDVAELLGNTEAVVRKHYSAWIPERQARLTKVLQEAFVDKPVPAKVVKIR